MSTMILAKKITFSYERLKFKHVSELISERLQAHSVLRYPDLNLTEGDRLVVTGKNGAGKTTLLRIILGVYKPTSGEIKTEGKMNSFLSISSGMAEALCGIDNIRLKLTYMGAPYRSIGKYQDEIIEFSGLKNVINRPLSTYSSGMKVRLAFAIATTLPCDILLMDEWISAGDSDFRKKAFTRLKSYVENVPIIVVASHDERIAERLGADIVNLENSFG